MIWTNNDLTALANGALAYLGSELHGYSLGDNSQHVNFIDANGHVHELYRSPDPAAQWVDNDLTALVALAGTSSVAGLGEVIASAFDGYSLSDNSQHVNFIDGFAHVHELYRSPNPAAQWVDHDLTALAAGAEAQLTPLNGYSQNDNSQHVNFIDANGHVHELYRSPDPAARWVDNDLNRSCRWKRPAIVNALYGYSQNDNSQHVNFIDANGHVRELYRSPDPGRSVGRQRPNRPCRWNQEPICALYGYSLGDNSQHVNFIGANGHVRELYRSPDPAAQWVDNDLTDLAGGTAFAAACPMGLISVHSTGTRNATAASTLISLRPVAGTCTSCTGARTPAAQWVDNDLTALAGGPPAGPGLPGGSRGLHRVFRKQQ